METRRGASLLRIRKDMVRSVQRIGIFLSGGLAGEPGRRLVNR